MKNLIIIAGPTASGKTALGIELAKRFNGEVVSADSMQIYKYMNIGTAKPDSEEMQGIVHHMIDVIEPDRDFSVALYKEMAGKAIDDIIMRGKTPIVVGGTGLYISSLTQPMDFSENSSDESYRTELWALAEKHGNNYVHEMLKDIDPISYERLFPNDVKRVVRALEVFKLTGKTISELQEESKKLPVEYNSACIVLTMDRKKLYDRINHRVDIMFQKGLIEEVKSLQEMGYSRKSTAMQGIGYKEVLDYLDSNASLEETLDIIKQSSRRYAKRQLTWFRKDSSAKWVDLDEFTNYEDLIKNIINIIEGKLKLI